MLSPNDDPLVVSESGSSKGQSPCVESLHNMVVIQCVPLKCTRRDKWSLNGGTIMWMKKLPIEGGIIDEFTLEGKIVEK